MGRTRAHLILVGVAVAAASILGRAQPASADPYLFPTLGSYGTAVRIITDNDLVFGPDGDLSTFSDELALGADTTALGSTSADLTTGTLKAFASSDDDTFRVLAISAIEDTMTADAAGAMRLDVVVSGDLLHDPQFADSFARATLNTALSASPSLASSIPGGGTVTDIRELTPLSGAAANGTNAVGCDNFDDVGGTCTFTLFDVNAQPGDSVAFLLALGADAALGTADLAHSLTLHYTGVPFTSASGVLLTGGGATPTPVPEPATWMLGLIGFIVCGSLSTMRRRCGSNA
jgi:hypothetical protein